MAGAERARSEGAKRNGSWRVAGLLVAVLATAPSLQAAVPARLAAVDTFSVNTLALGVWDAGNYPSGTGSASVENGWLRLRTAYSSSTWASRPAQLGDAGATLEARVVAGPPNTFFLSMYGPVGGVSIMFTYYGTYLLWTGGSTMIAPPGSPGTEHVLRLSLGNNGIAVGQVYAGGSLVASATAVGVPIRPSDITFIGLAAQAYSTPASGPGPADYSVDYVALLPAPLPDAPPLPGDGPA